MKAVAIKGCLDAPELANLSPSTEVWAINEQKKYPPSRVDRWFQLHGLGHMLQQHGPDYFRWMSECDVPKFYLFPEQVKRWPEFVRENGMGGLPLPRGVRPFPVKKATEEAFGGTYKTNSFDWLMALAMAEGFEEIHLVGVEYSSEELWKSRRFAADWLECSVRTDGKTPITTKDVEKAVKDLRGEGSGDESWARESIQYYIGLARGYFIDVTVPAKSGFFQNKWGGMYGLEGEGSE